MTLENNGIANHTGSYNMTPTDRAKEYGFDSVVYESLSFGNYDSPLDWILNLLIDDGVSSRIHRENMFRENITTIGIGFAPHKVYDFWYVINYAENNYITEYESEEEEEESEAEDQGEFAMKNSTNINQLLKI